MKGLILIDNNLSPSTVQQLPKLFSTFVMPSLRILYISERMWDAGVVSLFDDSVIRNFQNLEYLSLVGMVFENVLI